jgi:hypothetical protein
MTVHANAIPQPQVIQQTAPARIPWGFAELFIISQTALPALLIMPGTQAFRLPIRVSAFLLPLAAFAWWLLSPRAATPQSRAQSWLVAVMSLLALMLFHPQTPSFVGGLAHLAVYFAVMTPLFWAPAFVRSPEHLARILWILLICSGLNALVGVLQVYDPQRWLPAEFSRVVTGGVMGLGTATYIGPHGQRIVRPPGLFDTPGAVAGPAAYAALLGLVFAVSGAIPAWRRLLALIFAGAGLAAIYLTQVRVSLVVALGMMVVYALVSTRQGRLGRATQFAILAGGIIVGSFMLAFALGGQTIQDRILTLTTGDPLSVYQGARGVQMQVTFGQMLTDAPLGAGLGRWGMAAGYFGTGSASQSLWAEIQFTGWMIDGGVLMIALYLGALIVTAFAQYRVAIALHFSRLAQCGAVILAAGCGTAAMIFSFTPFVTQVGIQYWFLAGALHGVALRYGIEGA